MFSQWGGILWFSFWIITLAIIYIERIRVKIRMGDDVTSVQEKWYDSWITNSEDGNGEFIHLG